MININTFISIIFLTFLFHSNCFKSNHNNEIKSIDTSLTKAKTFDLTQSIAQSTKFNSDSFNILSFKQAGIAFITTALSLTSFNILTQQINKIVINNGYDIVKDVNYLKTLQIFDLRNGYTVEEVINVLNLWSHQGRLYYLLIETIDVLVYATSYRLLFLIIINNVMKSFIKLFPGLSSIHSFSYFPIFLAFVDLIEDVGQVTMTLLYDLTNGEILNNPILWKSIVNISSFINQTKWLLVSAGSSLLAIILSIILIKTIVNVIQNKKVE